MKRSAYLIASCILLLPCAAAGDIYKYVNEDGVTVFTDNPRHSGYKIHLRENGSFRLAAAGGYYPYRDLVVEACNFYRIDEALIRAVIEVESDYNRYAVSSAGARGLMQLMPETAKRLGVSNIWDPRQNVQAGTSYLKKFIRLYSGNLELALAAYNAGPSAVRQYGMVPPYPQTRSYVKKVMRLYRNYAGFRN